MGFRNAESVDEQLLTVSRGSMSSTMQMTAHISLFDSGNGGEDLSAYMLSITDRSLSNTTSCSMDENLLVRQESPCISQAVDDCGVHHRQARSDFEAQRVRNLDNRGLIDPAIRMEASNVLEPAYISNSISDDNICYFGAGSGNDTCNLLAS